MNSSRRRWLLLTPLLLGCGPFFYQAPPALNYYPSRIPGKSWNLLVDESLPPNADTSESLRAAAKEEIATWATRSAEERSAAIDALAARNRNAVRLDIPLANFLLEARELAAETDPAVASYLAGRIAAPHEPTAPPKPVRSWDDDDEAHAKKLKAWEAQCRESIRRSGQIMGSAPRVLAPYQRIRHAVLLESLGRHEAARALGESILQDFPAHARAEIARFMIARSWLNEARGPELPPDKVASLCDSAQQAFNAYLDAHPDGRFRGEATGWLGGISETLGDLGEAINWQLRRLEIQNSREATRAIMRECDRLIATLIQLAGDGGYLSEMESYVEAGTPDYSLLARHPAVLRLFLFHCLDPAYQVSFPIYGDNTTGDRGTLRFLEKRITRPSAFTQEALAHVASAVAARPDAEHAPDALLILGWSALRQGDATQALLLFDRGIALHATDELLHARAIALDDLKRHADAAAAYQNLLEKFPTSPLTLESGFDHAISLHKAGLSGEALLRLWDISGSFESPQERENWPNRPSNEIPQWIDSIAQFAAIPALEAPLAKLDPASPAARELRAIVRMRALASGDFTTARRWIDPSPLEDDSSARWGNRWHPRDYSNLDATRWDKEIAPLAALHAKRRSPAQELELARLWENLRGRLTLPLHQYYDYSGSEEPRLDQLRRINGRAIGFDDIHITRELDSRDELHHALSHYLAAAKSTDATIAAPALESANECLRRLAEFSLYRAGRAAETAASDQSSKLVQELRQRFPESVEAKRAIAYRFRPPQMIPNWMPGDYNVPNAAWTLFTTLHPEQGDGGFETLTELSARLTRAVTLAASPVALQEELAKVAADFLKARPGLDGDSINALSDDLQDLLAAAAVPDVPFEDLKNYCIRRINGEAPAEATGPLGAFEAFRQLRADPEATAAQWQDFLKQWPASPKTEAARLRLLRFHIREFCPVPQIRAFHFPAAPITAGYKHSSLKAPVQPFDAPALLREIASFRESYPQSTYASDVAMLEAAVHARHGEIRKTLAIVLAILANPIHPELHGDAGLHLAYIAQGLIEPPTRQAVLDALRAHPDALPWIRKLAEGDTFLFRLQPFLAHLEGK
ncbi:MAG: tetratricopeptide repeat protein [Akkermansiaceae bacterium]|jgi:tetratricopeptide (TPR) repeat protein|nr:tetratricopeptide repeat protein [Akkermansiaceae bacterium]